MEQLKTLSQEALVLWRLVLAGPVEIPVWELKRVEVRELLATGLVGIKPDVYPKNILDLKSEYVSYRLGDLQKELLQLMSIIPMTKTEYLDWAGQSGVSSPLSYLKVLTDLRLIESDKSSGELVFSVI